MKSIKVFISTIMIASIAVSSLLAQPGNGKQGMRGEGKRAMGDPAKRVIMQIPDLSEQQKSAIQKKAMETRKDILPLRNEMNEKRAHLQTLRTQESADLDAIHSTIEAIGELRITIAKERATMHQDVRQILNEEQRVWLDTQAPMKRAGKRMRGR